MLVPEEKKELEGLVSGLVQAALDKFPMPEGVPQVEEGGLHIAVRFVGQTPCSDPVFGPWTQVFYVAVKDEHDYTVTEFQGKLIDALASLMHRHLERYTGKTASFRHCWHTLSGLLYDQGLDPVSGAPFPADKGPPPAGLPDEKRDGSPESRPMTLLEGFDLTYGWQVKSLAIPLLTKVRVRLARVLIKFLLGEEG